MATEVSSPKTKGYFYSQLGSLSTSDLSTKGQVQSCNDSLDTDTSSHIANTESTSVSPRELTLPTSIYFSFEGYTKFSRVC